MALLGQVRKRVTLLLIFIGGSLVLFVLGDVVTSTNGLFGRTNSTLGVVGGEKITYPEFQRKVDEQVEDYKTSHNVETVDQEIIEQLRDQTWTDIINKNVLVKQYDELPVVCGDDELFHWLTSYDAPMEFKSLFRGKDNRPFDPNDVIKTIKSMPNADEKQQAQWNKIVDYFRAQRVANKYKGVTKGGVYITTAEAKRDFIDRQRNASVQYVLLNYNTVPDNSVKIEDSDLKKYYKEHDYLPEFNQKEDARKAEYVVWDIKQSDADRKDADEKMKKLYDEFKTCANDTLFVNQNSEMPFDSSFKRKGALPPLLDSLLFDAEIGTMVGPYEDGGMLKIAKLTAVKYEPDSVKASHILIKIANNDTTAAKSKADSLKNLIKQGQKFSDLAAKFSEDPGSGSKGGDLGWFKRERMLKPFADACFAGKKGDMPIVVSQYGVHLIDIVDVGKPNKVVQVGIVARKLEPSQKTYDEVFAKATKFAVENNQGDLFDAACVKQGLNKRVTPDMHEYDKFVPGLDQPREFVRWAFQAKKGEVSNKVLQFGDKYVVAHLIEVKNKGLLPLETVKQQVTVGVLKEKKAEMLTDKLEKAMADNATLEALGQKVNTTPVVADNVNFKADYITGVGSEPKLIGTIFTMKENVVSKPFAGENGVFVFKVTKFNEPPPTKDYSDVKRQLLQALQGRIDGEIFNALKELAHIVDNRGKFY